MNVVVVTDSAASLPPSVRDAAGVRVVPLRLIVGEDDIPDGTLPLPAVIARLGDGVSTSAPAPGDFLTAIEQAETEGAIGVVVVTVSSTMSAAHKSAWMASSMAEGDVAVVDSGTAAGGQGLVALAAARTASLGAGVQDVAAVAERVSDQVRVVASVPTLEHLARSGRVPGIAEWAGRMLGIQPLFEFRRAKVNRLVPAQSRQAALDRIFRRWRSSTPPHASHLHVAALHAEAEEEAEELLARVATEVAPKEQFVAEFSTVMVAHTGPGLVGLAWYWERA
jgi:DegV family protein with EDD domain